MSNSNIHDIRVEVDTRFLQGQSNPGKARYVFAYTVTIHNQGEVAAKLLKRHWLITDSNGKVQEVRGDGVVGEYPYLQPGQNYEYTSGTILETPVGSMEGSYLMESDDGDTFDAIIPPFRLAVPGVVN
ncbi:ApaG protein [Natronospira proteinivora]|uniref:Protein ApaG n=1 Tax=Natronospira proteinivora TaxID=1807133 RepID=A0ABT1G7W7_9GAMM|nr:Co2+/Mg2+ efflux protein ApaG [Natronospira proteinivora]MCP1727394.1 ApaG protein [Natronospira proteinivora]